jgi:membrane peptidoglycan carboxypeptidase
VFAQLELALGDGNPNDGAQQIADIATEMGVTAPLKAPAAAKPNASLVLGTEAVSPLDMASAYSTIARRGIRADPIAITKVVRPNKPVLTFGTSSQNRRKVLEPAQADLITDAMQGVITKTEGTGNAADFGQPEAGKTGTTQENRDAWFVGFVPTGLTAAVWMGYDDNRPMQNIKGPGPAFGGGVPARMWRAFMSAVTAGQDLPPFPAATDFVGEVLEPPTSTTVKPPPAKPTSTAAPVNPKASTTTTTTTATTAPPTTAPPTTEPPPETTVPEVTVPFTFPNPRRRGGQQPQPGQNGQNGQPFGNGSGFTIPGVPGAGG